MEIENKEDKLKLFAESFSDEVKAGAVETGESEVIQLLINLRDRLGETKLLNNPSFFYWQYEIKPLVIELCGYDIDEIDNSISLFAVDFGEPCHQILKANVDKLGNRATNFVKMALQKNEKALTAVTENEAEDLYYEIKKNNDISKIRVYVVSNGISNLRNRENKSSINGTNIDVEYILWDINWIYENCNTNKEHESIVLDFEDEELKPFVDNGLPYLRVPQSEKFLDCYQCVVPGRLLSYVYRKYGSPILEGNVRSFLTSKTAVNKNIQLTIQKEPKRFYVYNNGIAAVASAIEVDEGSSRVKKITDIQIINGGQTTASLAYAERKRNIDLSGIFVPMKLTVINEEEMVDSGTNTNSLIQMISKTSNSQNKVSDADFFANHPFHTLMKKYSLELSVPGRDYNTYWFYERARGEYAQELMFKSEKQKSIFEKTHPKSQYLRKTDFAKYCSLYEERPEIVSRGSGTNFNDFAKRVNEVYDKGQEAKYTEDFFKEMTSVALIYKELEPLISIKRQAWFGGSYRANVIGYAISLFFYLVRKRYPDNHFNLLILWDKGVSEALLEQFVELCRLVYLTLVDEERPEENVTQWAKKQLCWENMKEELGDTELDDEVIRKYLINKDELRDKTKTAKFNAAILIDTDIYRTAFDDGHVKAWLNLPAFIDQNPQDFSSLTSNDRIYISMMRNVVEGKGKSNPSGQMCKRALEILNDAEAFGFKW